PHNAGDSSQVSTSISFTPTSAREETGKKPVNSSVGGTGGDQEAATTSTVVTNMYCSSNKENSIREPNVLRRLSLGLKPVQNKRRKQTSVSRQSTPTSQPIITDFLRPKKRPISSIKDTLLMTSPKKRCLAF
ncbi:unnamed protein product, partial [Meganyctiphanes norvegica]